MLRQKRVALKTGSASLSYAEMGDIVCSSASSITISLPTPSPGLWYRISNVGTGTVSIGDITTLKNTEQALLFGKRDI